MSRSLQMRLCAACVGISAGAILFADPLIDIEMRITDAKARHGVTGRDVLVAILDRGIDWSHPDFRNDDGSTRIEGILDLTDSSGANDPTNTLRRGTVYTKQQIQEAIAGRTTIATRDAVGHGTSTAGLCCGNGRASGGKFKGPAENARLLIVKAVSDGAPAHDDQPAELAFYNPELLPLAIDWVVSKANDLRLPVVMLLNIGSTLGATDGSGALAKKIDATFGPGKRGLVFVTGTGDDGGSPNHASGRIEAGQTVDLQTKKGTATGQPLVADFWYDQRDRLDVTVVTSTGTFGPYVSPATERDYTQVTLPEFFLAYHGAQVHFSDATDNGKRRIYLSITGAPGTYILRLRGASIQDGRFEASLNPAGRYVSDRQGNNGFLNFLYDGKTLWDASTAFNNIAPNSYVHRTSWIDIDGVERRFFGEGDAAQLWKGSSIGPTYDGRLGVDVSAPGDRAITTYAPKSFWSTVRGNLVQDGKGAYGIAGAVSAAAPLTTGAIALLLEKSPTLSADEVKRLLQVSARRDAFTGPDPGPRFGYGKIDIAQALDTLAPIGRAERQLR